MSEDVVARIAADLREEVERRNQWYGLDNWSSEEVVRFVLDRVEPEPSEASPIRERTEGEKLAHVQGVEVGVESVARLLALGAGPDEAVERSRAIVRLARTTLETFGP